MPVHTITKQNTQTKINLSHVGTLSHVTYSTITEAAIWMKKARGNFYYHYSTELEGRVNFEGTRQTIYVLRKVEARPPIIDAVEKNKYYIFVCMCVCVRVPGRVGMCMRVRACSLACSTCNSHAPYCDVICSLSGSTIFFDIIS